MIRSFWAPMVLAGSSFLVSALFPHWLTIGGFCCVVIGLIGLAFIDGDDDRWRHA